MAIYAISDLHLSRGTDKPMNIFGPAWEDHEDRLQEHWKKTVGPDDLVLLPGDHSWGLKLEEAVPDLQFIDSLPGRKVLLKGNHDLWWQSRKKVEEVLPPSMQLLQNDSVEYGTTSVCGTRGWVVPGEEPFGEADTKIYKRELIRLEMSLSAAAHPGDIVVMMHFPPLGRKGRKSGFCEILERYGVQTCLYGHLHDTSIPHAFEGEKDGVLYRLVSGDKLGFIPLRIR